MNDSIWRYEKYIDNNNFSLDMPGPIIINATNKEIAIEKLIPE